MNFLNYRASCSLFDSVATAASTFFTKLTDFDIFELHVYTKELANIMLYWKSIFFQPNTKIKELILRKELAFY